MAFPVLSPIKHHYKPEGILYSHWLVKHLITLRFHVLDIFRLSLYYHYKLQLNNVGLRQGCDVECVTNLQDQILLIQRQLSSLGAKKGTKTADLWDLFLHRDFPAKSNCFTSTTFLVWSWWMAALTPIICACDQCLTANVFRAVRSVAWQRGPDPISKDVYACSNSAISFLEDI